ncbi:hypothetical protein ACFLVR_03905 [Chloroflexota bacterium]
MYCQKCGQELKDDAIKCDRCGELVVTRHKYLEWVLYVLAMIPLISSLVVWWWIIRVKTWDRFTKAHPKVHLGIIISSAASSFLVVSVGLNRLLAFIPQSWGSVSGSGEFTPLSITISTIVGVMAAITHLFILGKIKVLGNLTRDTEKSVKAALEDSTMGKLKGKWKAFSRSISKVTASEETAEAEVGKGVKTEEITEEPPSDEASQE